LRLAVAGPDEASAVGRDEACPHGRVNIFADKSNGTVSERDVDATGVKAIWVGELTFDFTA